MAAASSATTRCAAASSCGKRACEGQAMGTAGVGLAAGEQHMRCGNVATVANLHIII
jgi:hypothetical protein